MGAAFRRHETVRPVLLRVTRPASDSTSKCFMIAGKETGKGRAKSLTDKLSASPRRASSARRVGSARAAKVRSKGVGL